MSVTETKTVKTGISLATALLNMVFPVPGGPKRRMPLGVSEPVND